MGIYLTLLGLGGAGLGAMALGGFFTQGHGSATTHGGALPHGSGHAGGHAMGHTAGHASGHATGLPAGHAGHAPGHPSVHIPGARDQGVLQPLTALLSPRVLFSVCLGLGTTGLLLTKVLAGPTLFAVALAGGILFDRLIVTPIWKFAFRFESRPALTLESALASEATAASTFDADGHGLVAVEVDGQVMQVLGTLLEAHRAMGVQVRAGAKVRIEDVDIARNRCTVSLL